MTKRKIFGRFGHKVPDPAAARPGCGPTTVSVTIYSWSTQRGRSGGGGACSSLRYLPRGKRTLVRYLGADESAAAVPVPKGRADQQELQMISRLTPSP